MKRLFFFLLVCAAPILPAAAQCDSASFSFAAPDSLQQLKKLKLWATQYYIHRFRSGGTIPFVSEQGDTLGLYGDTCNFCAAALEGTAFVTDSAGKVFVLNYARRSDTMYVNCRHCAAYAGSSLNVESWGKTQWKLSSGYGDGVKNYRLLPYRTVAVDPAVIPYGTVIYIPQVRGDTILLPDGKKTVHDGYFFAGDVGGAIRKNHIDVFTGIFEGNPFPGVVTSASSKTFEAFLVSDRRIIGLLTAAHLK